jgi:lipopolysaccharide export LptBFGC system permease protein LptF
MPWTLQKYIFREMGKTFLLTAAALTGILGLGGGVLEMIKLGEVTPGQLFRMMGLVLPVAAALTLPIAALFSAAATYGRLSADNEFVACRSSGINLHVLFFPTVVLSLASAVVTFAFINFLIPGMVRNLNEFIGADVGAFIQQKLNRPRGITLGGRYRIYADDSAVDFAQSDRVVLSRVAFVEVDGEEWVRYGTARQISLRFDRDEVRLRASGSMSGLSFYDRRAGRFADLAEQNIPPNELPTLLPPQIKFLTLGELFNYWADPSRWHQVADAFARLRTSIGKRMVYDELLADWNNDKQIALSDVAGRYTVRAEKAARIPRDGGVELTDVTVDEERQGRRRTYTAKRATIDLSQGDTFEQSGLQIELFEVHMRDGTTSVPRVKEMLGPMTLSPQWLQRVANLSENDLLREDASGVQVELSPQRSRALGLTDPLSERRDRARDVLGAVVRKIIATIHERTAYSISVFGLVILGAALGIVFRGSHVLMAFGISFVPSLIVIITIVTGRQLASNANTHVVGLLLIWAGIAVVAALDWWTLARVLRR